MTAAPTPGQTVGPFFQFGMDYPRAPEVVSPATAGAVILSGRVLDGRNHPIPDAMVEIWQATPRGEIPSSPGARHRDRWTFSGFGRACTAGDGCYSFSTLVPGPTEPGRSAFWAMAIYARGLLDRLFTRAYVPGPALASDPFLCSLSDQRRETLIAHREPPGFRFDIRLQGPTETVFLHHRRQCPQP